jgi:hypothetical protein
MKKIFFSLIFLILTHNIYSKSFQISGYVKDKSSGELLPNAYISINSEKNTIAANNYGFFSLKVKTDSVTLIISFTGYKQYNQELKLKSDTTISCLLTSNNLIDEVTISRNLTLQMMRDIVGTLRLTGKETEKIPTILGEHDLVKVLQLMPGIKMGKEGTSGMYVRGGTPGQNLILLDDVPVYNVNHLFGYFSLFTPEAITSVNIYKGAFPARYGGRISSVMDIKMKEGNLFKPSYDFTTGTLSTKLIAEVPVVKGRSSLLVSGRRTYFDVLLSPWWNSSSWDGNTKNKEGYYFYDLNTKFFYDLGRSGKIYLSCYLGRDRFYSRSITKNNYNTSIMDETQSQEDVNLTYNWGNITSSLRWNKTFGGKIFLNATLLYSYYSYILEAKSEDSYILIDTIHSEIKYNNLSSVSDLGAYVDFDYYMSKSHHVTFGTRATRHLFIPSSINTSESKQNKLLHSFSIGSELLATEINSYAEDHISVNNNIKMNIGLHHSLYSTDNSKYSFFQPRFSAVWELNKSSIKCSAGYMVQPVHNLVNNSDGMAIDIWVPSELGIKPSSSVQFDLGYDWLMKDIFSFSVNGYWRSMNNILTYKNGETFFSLYDNWYEKVISGNGKSYGIEFSARKIEGKTTGWIGYTWSVSNWQFNSLNKGNPFPAPYDRRHYFTIAVNHQVSKKVQLSTNWVFASGEPLTISSTAYTGDISFGKTSHEIDFMGIFYKQITSPDQIIYYSSVNNYRLPCYHRLDLGIDFSREKKKGTRIWSISVYNVYARNNPFMVSIEEVNGNLTLKNFSPFRILPSISYRFIFK